MSFRKLITRLKSMTIYDVNPLLFYTARPSLTNQYQRPGFSSPFPEPAIHELSLFHTLTLLA